MIFIFYGGVRVVKNGCIKLPYSPLYFWTKTMLTGSVSKFAACGTRDLD